MLVGIFFASEPAIPSPASEPLTPCNVVTIAAEVRSQMKPKVFDVPSGEFPYSVSGDSGGVPSPHNYEIGFSPTVGRAWAPGPKTTFSEGSMFSDDTVYKTLAEDIQATTPYLEAKIAIQQFATPEPTLASVRSKAKRGEFETEAELQARIPDEYKKRLQEWRTELEASRQKVQECELAGKKAPYRVLIPGLTPRVQTTPVVFHCAFNPSALDRLINSAIPRLQPIKLPIFNISTLSFDDVQFEIMKQSGALGSPVYDFWGSQNVKIVVPSAEEGKRLKEGFEHGTVLMTAQCVPVITSARRERGGLFVRNATMYLTDIRFVYATKSPPEISGAIVTTSSDAAVLSDLNRWLGISGKAIPKN